ncbi:MAG TPA: J domain-containing protein [Bdellovibrio sp.]
MSFQASFKQILRDKMGVETPSAPLQEATILNADPAHLAYLLGQIGRFEPSAPRGHYPAPRVRPERKPHVFSSEQRQSFEFLKTWIQDLSEGFTATELKKAFRQAALRLHPDQGGSPEQFVSLKGHYETLQSVLPS